MKHLFIINPAAGKHDRTQEFTKEIRDYCDPRGLCYEIAVSKEKGDCTAIARREAETGQALRIYACGGDGTLNEVVAGVVGFANVAVTHFSGGSGNDFVKIFSEPAAFRHLDRLMESREAEFDLISCNDRYAINVCSVGFDARIGTQVADYKKLPLLSGSGAYVVSALVNTVRGISEHYVVELEGETLDGDETMICVANGRFYGGGFNPVPDADPADGLLDVLVVRPVSRLQVLSIIMKYREGRYKDYPELIRHVRTDHVRIRCDKETSVNLDGELMKAWIVDLRVAPEKIRFFYPKDLIWKNKKRKPAISGANRR